MRLCPMPGKAESAPRQSNGPSPGRPLRIAPLRGDVADVGVPGATAEISRPADEPVPGLRYRRVRGDEERRLPVTRSRGARVLDVVLIAATPDPDAVVPCGEPRLRSAGSTLVPGRSQVLERRGEPGGLVAAHELVQLVAGRGQPGLSGPVGQRSRA